MNKTNERTVLNQDDVVALWQTAEGANERQIRIIERGVLAKLGTLAGDEPTPEMVQAGAAAARDYYERTGGNDPVVVYKAMRAVTARLVPAASQAFEVPDGFALVPVRPNPEMDRIMATEDWAWADLLAAAGAITEEQYNSLAVPLAQPDVQSRGAQSTEVERLATALRFYADGEHFVRHDPTVWDTVSGEGPNFYEDEANSATVEDGTFARVALGDLVRQTVSNSRSESSEEQPQHSLVRKG